ncbi:hypothetical protein ACFL6S_18960 [Candidatus Poribacteria bacterium]
MSKSEKRKERKEQLHAFQTEFRDTASAIVDRLLNPRDDSPEGFVIEYEVINLRFLANALCQRLPIRLQRVERKPVKRYEGVVLLWHGTSLRRAESIMESGFRSKKRGIFFSSNIFTSLSFAERRASDGHGEPAIFAAIHDLGRLRHGKEFRHQFHYIFRPGTANQIVKYLLTCHGLYSIGKIATEASGPGNNLTDITVTQVSGSAGIAYWLNSFLGLDDSEHIPEDHPVVGQIKTWVDDQYASGRMEPITDEEMLNLTKELLPEYLYSRNAAPTISP